MRALKAITVIAAILVGIFSVVAYITHIGTDVAPVITCTQEETIEASVKTPAEDLLKYVTAKDEQDGDLTDKIKVSYKRFFIETKPYTTIVSFSVCDSDNNVTTLQRMLVFTDYQPPTIGLTSDFIFPGGYNYDLKQYVKASDILDGDLNDYIKVISPEFTNNEGEYPINIKVSNSMGDSTEVTFKGMVTGKDYFSTKVRLTDYIAFTKVGVEPDYNARIRDIFFNNAPKIYTVDDIKIDTSKVDHSKPGVYDAYYRIFDDNGDVAALTRLVVVVTE